MGTGRLETLPRRVWQGARLMLLRPKVLAILSSEMQQHAGAVASMEPEGRCLR